MFFLKKQAASNKVTKPKDTTQNWFSATLFVICRHNTGSCLEVGAFLSLTEH